MNRESTGRRQLGGRKKGENREGIDRTQTPSEEREQQNKASRKREKIHRVNRKEDNREGIYRTQTPSKESKRNDPRKREQNRRVRRKEGQRVKNECNEGRKDGRVLKMDKGS